MVDGTSVFALVFIGALLAIAVGFNAATKQERDACHATGKEFTVKITPAGKAYVCAPIGAPYDMR